MSIPPTYDPRTSFMRYTMPVTMQEQLNRLASQALVEIGFTHEDAAQMSDAYRLPKELAHLPIRMYIGELDTPTHIYQRLNSLVWSKKHWGRNSERVKLYNLAEQYRNKVEELIEKIPTRSTTVR